MDKIYVPVLTFPFFLLASWLAEKLSDQLGDFSLQSVIFHKALRKCFAALCTEVLITLILYCFFVLLILNNAVSGILNS